MTTDRPPIHGQTYEFDCDIMDANPSPTSYSWRRGPDVLPAENNKQLELTLDREIDDGDYTCRAQNTPGWGDYGQALALKVWCE